MATEIVFDNIVGSEIEIPPVGTDRGGECVIKATHGFFKSVRTDSGSRTFIKKEVLTKAGATITGNLEGNSQGGYFCYENLPHAFKGARLGSPGPDNERICRFYNTYLWVSSSSLHNTSVVNKQNALGETVNCLRKTANGGTLDMYRRYATWWDYNKPLTCFSHQYIEEEEGNVGYLMVFENSIKISRTGYTFLDSDSDSSGWGEEIPFPNDYKIPSQEWFTIELEIVPKSSTQLAQSVNYLKITDSEGEHLIFDTPKVYTNSKRKQFYWFGIEGGDTSADYHVHACTWFIPLARVVDEVGQEGADEFYRMIKLFTKPVN